MDTCIREIASLLKDGTDEERGIAADMLDDLGLNLVASYARLEGWEGGRARHAIWFLIERTEWRREWRHEEVADFEWVKQLVDFVLATSERDAKICTAPAPEKDGNPS